MPAAARRLWPEQNRKTKKQGGETRKNQVRVYPAWQMKGPMRNKHKHPQQTQKEGHKQKKKRAKKNLRWRTVNKERIFGEVHIVRHLHALPQEARRTHLPHRRQHSVSIILVNRILSISQVKTARPASGGPPHPPHPCDRSPLRIQQEFQMTENRAITDIDGKIKTKMKEYQILIYLLYSVERFVSCGDKRVGFWRRVALRGLGIAERTEKRRRQIKKKIRKRKKTGKKGSDC